MPKRLGDSIAGHKNRRKMEALIKLSEISSRPMADNLKRNEKYAIDLYRKKIRGQQMFISLKNWRRHLNQTLSTCEEKAHPSRIREKIGAPLVGT